MKKEELKRALKLCAKGCNGSGCVYNEIVGNMECGVLCPPRCVDLLATDALELIENLEERIAIMGEVEE